MEELLHERVIGQDVAVTAISRAIRRARVGLKTRIVQLQVLFSQVLLV